MKKEQGPEVVEHKNLAAALLGVQGDVGTIQTTGKLPVGGGKQVEVASIGDITRALQPLMVKHGVSIFPTRLEHQNCSVIGKTRSGSDMFRVDLVVVFKVLHRDSDETAEIVAFGQGTDTGDKAGYGAMTGAQKYMHRLTFHLPTEHDPDKKESVQVTSQPQQHRNAPSATTAKKKTASPHQAMWRAIWSEAKKVAERVLTDEQKKAVEKMGRDTLREHGFESTTEIPLEEIAGIKGEIIGCLEPVLRDTAPAPTEYEEEGPDIEDLDL